jgi:hypothetical protein
MLGGCFTPFSMTGMGGLLAATLSTIATERLPMWV